MRSKTIRGVGVCPGKGVGRASVRPAVELPHTAQSLRSCEEEWSRFHSAREDIIAELKRAEEGISDELHEFVESTAMILLDHSFEEGVRESIEEGVIAERAVYDAVEKYASRLGEAKSSYIKERADDLRGLCRDIVGRLGDRSRGRLVKMDGEVLVAVDLSVPDAIAAARAGVVGVALEKGAVSGHAAIILRNYGIPAVFQADGVVDFARQGRVTVVDGDRGVVLPGPSKSTLAKYSTAISRARKEEKSLEPLEELPSVTLDGRMVPVEMNLDLPDEIEVFTARKPDGVGLFRTEYLFTTTKVDEPSQLRIYRKLADITFPKRLVVRVFDLGGDKTFGTAGNPFMGLRGIRYLLKNKPLFRSQLRAAARANLKGNVQLLIPMVSTLYELLTAKSILEECYRELKVDGRKFGKLRLGMMVETPSAALMSDIFLRHVDFISIGTNDLTQYTLAVDRKNYEVSGLYDQLHPSVLRLVSRATQQAQEVGKAAGVCGELASEPLGVTALLALGVDSLSVSGANLLRVRKRVRQTDCRKLSGARKELLVAQTGEEVRSILARYSPDPLV